MDVAFYFYFNAGPKYLKMLNVMLMCHKEHVVVMEAFLDTWIDNHGWPTPRKGAAPLLVFEKAGIMVCAWCKSTEDLAVTLQNKKEALVVKFYGNPGTAGRTSFMATGYSLLAQYGDWATSNNLSLSLDTAAKAKLFLEFRLEAARDTWKSRSALKHKGCANSAAESAHNAYRQCVSHLSALSIWQGYGINMVETEEMQTLRLSLVAEVKRSKVRVQDSAATSALMTKRLDGDEWQAMIDGMWSGRLDKAYKTANGRERAAMRALLCCVLNSCVGRRGGDLRNLDLRMFMWHSLPDVRPVACWTIGASLRTVKEDNTLEDKEHLLGWMRARDRLACPVGVLAGYLVWMNAGSSQSFLDVMREDMLSAASDNHMPKWWSISLLGGRNAEVSLSSTTHTKLTHAAFDSGCVYGKKAVTHIHRPTALGAMLEGGVVSTDAALYQGWVHGVWADTYAKASFKTLPMLKGHGWDARMDAWECWWEGTENDIPQDLLDAVFPELDELILLAERRWVRLRDDKSAVEFLRVMRVLRRAFIEDSIHNQPKYPEWPPYLKHPIWTNSRLRRQWEAYAAEERKRCVQREQEWRLRQHDPALANALIEQLHAAQQTQRELTEALRGLKLAAGSAAAPAKEMADTDTILPPELQEPHAYDLKKTYDRWNEPPYEGGVSARAAYAAYLAEHKRIAWAKIFDKKCANAAKVRYYRMVPFLTYIDNSSDPQRSLDQLQEIMKERKVDGAKFIKNAFYALAVKGTIDTPIPAAELAQLMQARGLRPITTSP